VSHLDHSRPFGTVMEMPGVRFQQDGVYFRADGSPIAETTEPVRAMTDPPDTRLRNNGWSEDDLRRPENKALKAQLDVYGEEWSTRKAALEFLQRGRG
jgi:hypothetical protein